MKHLNVLWTTMISVTVLLSACGDKDGGVKEKPPKAETQASTQPESIEVPITSEKESSPSDTGGILNSNIALESGGTIEVVYTVKSPGYTHNMKGFKVSVDEYQIVKVTDMNKDVTIPFDGQSEGYLITAKVSIENGMDKAMYYNNTYRIQLKNEYDYISSERTFVRPEDQPRSKIENESGKYAAGEKVSGLVSFTVTGKEYDSFKSSKPKFIIEGGAADNSSFEGSIKGNSMPFDFIWNDEQKQQVEGDSKLYPDRLTTDNLADKKIIMEKSDIKETKSLGDVKVTLNGVQYSEVLPTEANKKRFKSFGDSGIVAITVKLKLDNQSNQALSIFNLGSKLQIDDDRGTVLSQSLLEPQEPSEIAAGELGEKYHVFLFRKDEFQLFKKFDLEFGPFYGNEGQALFKSETVMFSLPK